MNIIVCKWILPCPSPIRSKLFCAAAAVTGRIILYTIDNNIHVVLTTIIIEYNNTRAEDVDVIFQAIYLEINTATIRRDRTTISSPTFETFLQCIVTITLRILARRSYIYILLLECALLCLKYVLR